MGGKIVVIDDNENDPTVAHNRLHSDCYNVQICENGGAVFVVGLRKATVDG